MILVADASPLIFLGKIQRLALLEELFAGEILLPSLIREEVLRPPLPPGEETELRAFLETCTAERVAPSQSPSAALSAADNAVFTLAKRVGADRVLADDRLLREVIRTEGIRPMGTLGVLLHARRQGLLSKAQALRDLEQLVQHHAFRIGIEVYDWVRRAFDTP